MHGPGESLYPFSPRVKHTPTPNLTSVQLCPYTEDGISPERGDVEFETEVSSYPEMSLILKILHDLSIL